MKFVEIYLKTELFTLTQGHGHLPRGAVILQGTIREPLSGGFIVEVSHFRGGRGQPLSGDPIVLFIPLSKIDHIQLREAAS